MLDDWCTRQETRPSVIAEIEDSSLTRAFSRVIGTLFVAPTLTSDQVATLYRAAPVEGIPVIQERCCAISREKCDIRLQGRCSKQARNRLLHR